MDKFKQYIDPVLKGVNVNKEGKAELEEEIYDHLEMLAKEFMNEGYSKEEAERKATERFGEIKVINKKLKSVYTPFRRWKEAINKKNALKEVLQWTSVIVFSLLISLSIKSYAFASAEIHQSSMENTLYEGHKIIENKLEYYYSKPQRGDIVIINKEQQEVGLLNIFASNTKEFIEGFYKTEQGEDKRLIKRIIGIPGDVIDIKDGKVHLNAQVYEEPYAIGETYPNSMEFPITIPDKEYFVLGDNREVSLDSRDLGLISIDKIEGKAVTRLWPLDKFGSLYE